MGDLYIINSIKFFMNIKTINAAITELEARNPGLEYIKQIKTGKEAEVHLVQANGQLMALKIYKENQKYSSRLDYMPAKGFKSRTLRKAIEQKSSYGRKRLESIWSSREYKILKKLGEYTEHVAQAYDVTQNALLIEYFGDESEPAPRLSDIKLEKDEAIYALDLVIEHIELFIELGFVHGDLSAYNILWFEQEPIIIDFPQVLVISQNDNAYARLKVDIENVKKYFGLVWTDETQKRVEEILNKL